MSLNSLAHSLSSNTSQMAGQGGIYSPQVQNWSLVSCNTLCIFTIKLWCLPLENFGGATCTSRLNIAVISIDRWTSFSSAHFFVPPSFSAGDYNVALAAFSRNHRRSLLSPLPCTWLFRSLTNASVLYRTTLISSACTSSTIEQFQWILEWSDLYVCVFFK
jgi:hypothetical protein